MYVVVTVLTPSYVIDCGGDGLGVETEANVSPMVVVTVVSGGLSYVYVVVTVLTPSCVMGVGAGGVMTLVVTAYVC